MNAIADTLDATARRALERRHAARSAELSWNARKKRRLRRRVQARAAAFADADAGT